MHGLVRGCRKCGTAAGSRPQHPGCHSIGEDAPRHRLHVARWRPPPKSWQTGCNLRPASAQTVQGCGTPARARRTSHVARRTAHGARRTADGVEQRRPGGRCRTSLNTSVSTVPRPEADFRCANWAGPRPAVDAVCELELAALTGRPARVRTADLHPAERAQGSVRDEFGGVGILRSSVVGTATTRSRDPGP